MKNLLSYELSKLGSEDVNYGAFEVASDTGYINFTYLKHGYDAKYIELRVVFIKGTERILMP